MRGRALLFVSCLLFGGAAYGQAVWQPTPPPLVTAENESWYRSGERIEWNGEFYYPAGAPQAFNPYQMVRAGSYRGIPLYTDTTLEPYSIVLVPISGARLQPYERPRAGALASTTGSLAPSFPPQTVGSLNITNGGFVAQAPAPPMFARPYDLGPGPEAAPQPAPQAIGTAGRIATTAGRNVTTPNRTVTVTNRTASSAVPPKGVNGAWLDYNGRRWVSTGKAIDLTSDFQAIGTYRGFPVYVRNGDRSTIYVPSTPGLVVPYAPRGR